MCFYPPFRRAARVTRDPKHETNAARVQRRLGRAAAGLGKMLLQPPPPRRSLGLELNYESSASLESSGIGTAAAAAEPRQEAGGRAAAAARLSKGQHHGFGFHSILLKMSGLEVVKHADWLQFGELLSVPKEALDKERWLHLLAAYDPDGSGEIPVSEVVTDALQPVAVELITCLARTVHTLSGKVLPYWLYMDSRSPGP